MAVVGQIYYNVQLNELRPEISSTPGITSATFWGPNWSTGRDVAALDLIGADRPIANDYINHLGIQGPPGLIFTIATSANDDVGSHFMLGRTGVFELEDEIYMLKIEPIPKWVLNQEATDRHIAAGIANMRASEEYMEQGLHNRFDYSGGKYTITFQGNTSVDIYKFPEGTDEQGKPIDPSDPSNWGPADWENYKRLQYICSLFYNYGLSEHTKGINGEYDPAGYQDVNNLIIDYSFG